MGCGCSSSLIQYHHWDTKSLSKDTNLVIDPDNNTIWLKQQNQMYELCLIAGNYSDIIQIKIQNTLKVPYYAIQQNISIQDVFIGLFNYQDYLEYEQKEKQYKYFDNHRIALMNYADGSFYYYHKNVRLEGVKLILDQPITMINHDKFLTIIHNGQEISFNKDKNLNYQFVVGIQAQKEGRIFCSPYIRILSP